MGRGTARPLVVVVDQVEEAPTRPADDPYRELDDFAADLAALAAGSRPLRRLILGFRKEWLARDLLADPDAPLAPTLQVLLAKMWEAAPRTDDGRRVFDVALYERLARAGILLGDFVDQELAALAAWRPDLVDYGLALDLLHAHMTPVGGGPRGR